jgi:hypothetical protein
MTRSRIRGPPYRARPPQQRGPGQPASPITYRVTHHEKRTGFMGFTGQFTTKR